MTDVREEETLKKKKKKSSTGLRRHPANCRDYLEIKAFFYLPKAMLLKHTGQDKEVKLSREETGSAINISESEPITDRSHVKRSA